MFFDSVSNFFGGVKTFFQNGYNTVSGAVHSVYDKITDTGVNIVKTVHTDVSDVFTGAKNIITHTVDTTKDVVNRVVDTGKTIVTHGQDTLGNTISNTASSLSFPLVIGAGLVGYLMLNKKS